MVVIVAMNHSSGDPTPLSPKELSPEFLGVIRSHTDLAIETLRDTDPTQNLGNLDLAFTKVLNSELSADELERRSEYNIILAKHGYPPIDSIDGLIKLQQLLAESFRSSQLLPMQVKQEMARCQRDLQLLDSTRHDFLVKGQEEARHAALLATQALERTQIELETERIKSSKVIDDATAEVRSSTVANQRSRGISENERQVLPRELTNDLLKKRIGNSSEFTRLIWGVISRPLKWCVVLVVLAMIYSLIIELGKSEMYSVIAPFNDLRHLIFDPIWSATLSIFDQLTNT